MKVGKITLRLLKVGERSRKGDYCNEKSAPEGTPWKVNCFVGYEVSADLFCNYFRPVKPRKGKVKV